MQIYVSAVLYLLTSASGGVINRLWILTDGVRQYRMNKLESQAMQKIKKEESGFYTEGICTEHTRMKHVS